VSAPGCRCDGSGVIVALNARCPCMRENSDDTLDRIKAERDHHRSHNEVLERMVDDLRRDRDLIKASYDRLQAAIAKFATEAGRG
jgi:hypothetical protein